MEIFPSKTVTKTYIQILYCLGKKAQDFIAKKLQTGFHILVIL